MCKYVYAWVFEWFLLFQCNASSTPATHPERWYYAWHATDDNQTIPMESIVATLPNAAEVAGFLHAY